MEGLVICNSVLIQGVSTHRHLTLYSMRALRYQDSELYHRKLGFLAFEWKPVFSAIIKETDDKF